MSEKFILTKTLHLGFVKDTFRAGAVIEHDEDKGRLVIDGRRFDDTRDLDILQRHGWIVPYDEEVLAEFRQAKSEPVVHEKPKPIEGMKVVQSDEDLMPDPIDIRDTQVSKRNQEAKEAARNKAKQRSENRQMEIIKGDETVEERLASLKDKTDINSISERVRLKRQKAAMPVVKDDSLGAGVGRSEIPLNAGQNLPSREEAEAKKAGAQAAADARKKQVEKTREKAGVDVPEGVGEVDEVVAQEVADATEGLILDEAVSGSPEAAQSDSGASESVDDIDAQIAALQAKKAAMEGEKADKPVRTPVRA